jgi:hypothetical protein
MTYKETFVRALGVDPLGNVAALPTLLAEWGVEAPSGLSRDALLDLALSTVIAPRFARDCVTFVYDYPASQAALAQIKSEIPPVAARFEITLGSFEAGTVIIGNRLRGVDMHNAHGLDCIVGLPSGVVLFRWVIRGQGETWTLVPHDRKADVQYDQAVVWIAKAVMAVSFY